MDSVFQGLQQLSDRCDRVVVHDAVRPLLSPRLLRQVIQASTEYPAVIPGIPAKETVKELSSSHMVRATLDRSRIWLVQTPQIFQPELLLRAHQQAQDQGWNAPDDAYLAEKMGCSVRVVPGSECNVKITTAFDLRLAELLLRQNLVILGSPD